MIMNPADHVYFEYLLSLFLFGIYILHGHSVVQNIVQCTYELQNF